MGDLNERIFRKMLRHKAIKQQKYGFNSKK
jgi:hypothetical protein